MKRPILLMITALICFSLAAQKSIDLLNVTGRYGLPRPYENDHPGKATESGGNINLVLPVRFSESTIWANDFNYFLSHVTSNTRMLEDIVDPITLNGFILQTGLIQKINKNHTLWLIFTPRYMTDFHKSDEPSLQLGGTFLFEKKFNDHLTMRYGAMYNHEFFSSMVVPLVYINWQVASRWNISGLLPIYSKLKYKVNDRLIAGIGHFGLITSYRLGEPENADYYMEKECIDIFLFGRYHLFGNFHTEGRIGYALDRKYAQYQKDEKMDFRLSIIKFGDDRTQTNVCFKDGPFASLSLVYSLPLPD
jgi:hypothetical protein